MPSKRKPLRTFRVSPFHNAILNTPPYKGHAGLLVRVLLDAFFSNELPELRTKFLSAAELSNGTTEEDTVESDAATV